MKRKNPDMTTWLILGGAAAGAWWYFNRKKAPQPGIVTVTTTPTPSAQSSIFGLITDGINKLLSGASSSGASPSYVSQIKVGTSGPSNTGSQPILAVDSKHGLFLKKRLSGGYDCWNFQGNRVAESSCAHLKASLALEGCGSLGSRGLGSLGS